MGETNLKELPRIEKVIGFSRRRCRQDCIARGLAKCIFFYYNEWQDGHIKTSEAPSGVETERLQ